MAWKHIAIFNYYVKLIIELNLDGANQTFKFYVIQIIDVPPRYTRSRQTDASETRTTLQDSDCRTYVVWFGRIWDSIPGAYTSLADYNFLTEKKYTKTGKYFRISLFHASFVVTSTHWYIHALFTCKLACKLDWICNERTVQIVNWKFSLKLVKLVPKFVDKWVVWTGVKFDIYTRISGQTS